MQQKNIFINDITTLVQNIERCKLQNLKKKILVVKLN